MYGCKVEKVPCCRLIPSVPHLLGDDLTRTLENDGTVEESGGFERVVREWVEVPENLLVYKKYVDILAVSVVHAQHEDGTATE
jgi:hypothetical protein